MDDQFQAVDEQCQAVYEQCQTVDEQCQAMDEQCQSMTEQCQAMTEQCQPMTEQCQPMAEQCQANIAYSDLRNLMDKQYLILEEHLSGCSGFVICPTIMKLLQNISWQLSYFFKNLNTWHQIDILHALFPRPRNTGSSKCTFIPP